MAHQPAEDRGKHHQPFDVEHHRENAQATNRKMPTKDRPLENDFVTEAEFDEQRAAWFGNLARVLQFGRAFLHLGRLRQLRHTSSVVHAEADYANQVRKLSRKFKDRLG